MLSMFRSNDPKPAPMSAADAIVRLAQGDIVVVDIRDPGEIAASGAAVGALRLPLASLRMTADPRSPDCHDELKAGKPVVLYCASGGRAGMAKGLLEELGHAEVHNIGGLVHWHQAGGPIAP